MKDTCSCRKWLMWQYLGWIDGSGEMKMPFSTTHITSKQLVITPSFTSVLIAATPQFTEVYSDVSARCICNALSRHLQLVCVIPYRLSLQIYKYINESEKYNKCSLKCHIDLIFALDGNCSPTMRCTLNENLGRKKLHFCIGSWKKLNHVVSTVLILVSQ